MNNSRASTLVPPDAKWRTSTYSGGNNECIQVAENVPHLVPVRDSKRPTGPLLGFSHNAWSTFLTHLT